MDNEHTIELTVNGVEVTARVPARMLLADFLRNSLKLTGTHIGCEHGVCGACTVSFNGDAIRSCLMFAVQANGCAVKTVEGLAKENGEKHPLQKAFRHHHALQCGFCTSGVLMSLSVLLDKCVNPDELKIRDAISGHICRCTGYQAMVEATAAVSRAMLEHGGS